MRRTSAARGARVAYYVAVAVLALAFLALFTTYSIQRFSVRAGISALLWAPTFAYVFLGAVKRLQQTLRRPAAGTRE